MNKEINSQIADKPTRMYIIFAINPSLKIAVTRLKSNVPIRPQLRAPIITRILVIQQILFIIPPFTPSEKG